jgi:hypothetical protein
MSHGRSFSPGTLRTTFKGSYVPPWCPLLHTGLRAHGAPIALQVFQNLFLSTSSHCCRAPLPVFCSGSLSSWALASEPLQMFSWVLYFISSPFSPSVSKLGSSGPSLYHGVGTKGSCTCYRRLDTCSFPTRCYGKVMGLQEQASLLGWHGRVLMSHRHLDVGENLQNIWERVIEAAYEGPGVG